MATDDEDSPASSTYGNDDESSDEMLDGGSDEEESEDGDEVEGDEADDDSGAEGQLELITDNGAFLNNHSGLRDTRPAAPPRSLSSRSLSPTHIRRGLFRTVVIKNSYYIEPICAIPHPVPTHSLAASLCMTHFLTGSEDGFIRNYDFFAGVNGKVMLTAPQRHHCGLGEAPMKGGVIRSWWENPANGDSEDDGSLSPVYSMVVHSDALWGISGTTNGPLNLFTIRNDPGKVHHVFRGHSGPVAAMCLQSDETGVLSAGWDGQAIHWDLNTGQMTRKFPSHGPQYTAIGLRPLNPANPAPVYGANGTHLSIHPELTQTINPQSGPINTDPAPFHQTNGKVNINGAPPSEASEDASGDTDDGYDPLFDDEPPTTSLNGTGGPNNLTNQLAVTTRPNGVQYPQSNTNSLSLPVNGRVPPSTQRENTFIDPVSYADFSDDILMTASFDGQVTLWDRRASSSSGKRGVGTLEGSEKAPPWCISACWSADGGQIYAGRRNGTIDAWDVRKFGNVGNASSGQSGQGMTPCLLKTLRNPASSGSVVCVAAFPNKRHVVCASQDNIRLWNMSDDADESMRSRNTVPFKIIAGHHGGIVSQILVDATCKWMITASGNRGWFGDSTRTILVHSIIPQ